MSQDQLPANSQLKKSDLSWIDRELDFFVDLSPDIRKYSRANFGALSIFEYNDKYLHYELFPREKTALKIIYGLELDDQDKEELQWLKDNKGIDIECSSTGFHEIVFVMGRKSGKTAFAAIITSYECYRIHQIYDPHQFFGLLPDSPISVVACSASGKQAEEMHTHIEAAIRNSSYFAPYIDTFNKKDISLFTQKDLDSGKGRGKGSINIHTLHSLSRTIRTYNAFVVIMDELAHMIDNRGVYSGHALYQSLTPSVTLFKKWGRIISLSSPLGKAGKLYELHDMAKTHQVKSIVSFQYASWEFNPRITEKDFEDEFKKDPESAEMEYRGNFGAVVDAYLPSDKVEAMFKTNRNVARMGNPGSIYVVTVDPSKNGDRYVVVVGHKEVIQIQGRPVTHKFVDVMKYFQAEVVKTDDGYKKVDIDIESVENFILGLPRKGFRIGLIAYDQFQSTSSIQKFQKLKFNAMETTFTNKYKEIMYGDLKTDLMNETIICYGTDEYIQDSLSSVELARIELKNIQRRIHGKTISIGHPLVGPVQNDDFSDAIANLNYLLNNEKLAESKMGQSVAPVVASVRGIG